MKNCVSCDECGKIVSDWDSKFLPLANNSNWNLCGSCREDVFSKGWIGPDVKVDFCYFLINKESRSTELYLEWDEFKDVINDVEPDTFRFGVLQSEYYRLSSETVERILKAPPDEQPELTIYIVYNNKERLLEDRDALICDYCENYEKWMLTKEYFEDKIAEFNKKIKKFETKLQSMS